MSVKTTRVCDGCGAIMPDPEHKSHKLPAGWRQVQFVGPSGGQKQDLPDFCPDCATQLQELITLFTTNEGRWKIVEALTRKGPPDRRPAFPDPEAGAE